MAPTAAKAAASFPCEDCGKMFTRKEYVKRHRRLAHLGHRPFVCDACGNGFARSDLLKRHTLTCAGADKSASKSAKFKAKASSKSPSSLSTDGNSPSDLSASFEPVASTSALAFNPTLQSSAPIDPFTRVTSLPAYLSPVGSSTSPSASDTSPGAEGSSASSVHSAESLGQKTQANGYSLRGPEWQSEDFADWVGQGTQLELEVARAVEEKRRRQALGEQATLAPALAAQGWAGGWEARSPKDHLTENEVEASEVLENLLRSPREGVDSSSTALVGGYSPGPLASTGDSMWADTASSNIEFSQEAEALAEYFNQGGVGGITALDLGFFSQPTLFPEHLFEPRVAEDPKLFVPSSKFAACFLSPWSESMPDTKTIERLARVAALKVLPSIPLFHPGAVDFVTMEDHTVFALSVAGGALDKGNEGEHFASNMLLLKRVFIVDNFNMPGASGEDRFKNLQSMLLYQLTGFYRSEDHRLMSHSFHPALCEMWKQLDLVLTIRAASSILAPDPRELEGEELESAWRNWAKVETWKRVSFIVHLIDLEMSATFKSSPVLPFSQLDIELPGSEELWKAKSAQEWQDIHKRTIPTQPPNFLASIKALLATGDAAFNGFNSVDGNVIAQLTGAPTFSLLILARTLSFLEAKTVETIKQSEPFRRMVGGVMKQKEDEERKLLGKIKVGRQWLANLPGGQKRGGGFSWLCEVLPEGTKCEQPKKTQPAPELLRKIEKDTAKMGENWPAFVHGETVLDTTQPPENILSDF